jgi:hypothetical protein
VGVDVDLALLEPLPKSPVVLRSSVDEPFLVDRCLTAGVRHDRQFELGQAVHHSTTNARDIDDCPYPVVLPGFVINVPHRLGDVAGGDHGVGLVVGR